MIEIQLAALTFAPGAQVGGRYTVEGDTARAEVSLIWHTEGKGTEHRVVVVLLEHADADFGPSGARRSGTFSMTLPAAPTSYSGTLLQIRWLVRVRTWGADERSEVADAALTVGGVSPAQAWKVA